LQQDGKIFTNLLIILKNFFLEKKTNTPHKEITNSFNVYFLGGLIFLIGIIFINIDNLLKLFLLLMFLLGLASDKSIINLPKKRFFLQLVIVISSVVFLDFFIFSTKIVFIDNLLDHYYFKLFFTTICILILINGSNFIDGVNLNLVGYYLIIAIILNILCNNENIILEYDINLLICFLTLIYILNFNGKIICGDSGAYTISYLFGYILIEFSKVNTDVSPLFVMLLLWYPAFENLFSILRKQKLRKSPLKPDFKHLHQLIFAHLKKKYVKKKIIYLNNLTGLLINFYNLTVFLIALNYYYNSKVLMLIVTFNIIIYLKIYFFYQKKLS